MVDSCIRNVSGFPPKHGTEETFKRFSSRPFRLYLSNPICNSGRVFDCSKGPHFCAAKLKGSGNFGNGRTAEDHNFYVGKILQD